MGELGPVSQAILDYVNERSYYIEFFRMIHAVNLKTGAKHTNNWYRTRLMALALEGHIEGKVSRKDDAVIIRFRRLPKKVLEELSQIEELERLEWMESQEEVEVDGE